MKNVKGKKKPLISYRLKKRLKKLKPILIKLVWLVIEILLAKFFD